MQTALFASLLMFTVTVAATNRRYGQPPDPADQPAEGEHDMYYPERESEKTCEELCVEDKGLDAETCHTECAVGTDLTTHHMDEGVDQVVEDEATNEAGGEAMEEKAEAEHPIEVLDCTPTVDVDHTPELSEIDTNQNGVLDETEAEEWGQKACVSDEMVRQIFHQADVNCDHVIDKEEFEQSGEDTAQEEAVDKALEEHSEGDDEYNPVQTPPLEEFDGNKDGSLDPEEHSDAMEFEMERRAEDDVADSEVPPAEADEAFDTVDTDDNGAIDGKEYEEPAADGGSNMGEEVIEAANADEDATDPDDLSGVEAAPPAGSAAASMLSTRFKVAQRNEEAFLKRFNLPERKHNIVPRKHAGRVTAKKPTRRAFGHFGRAFVELARKHQALRKKHQALRQKHQALRQKNLRSRRHTSVQRHRAS